MEAALEALAPKELQAEPARVVMTGMHSDRWRPLAEALAGALGSGYRGELADAGTPPPPRARLLVFIEHPARSLASAMSSSTRPSTSSALHDWRQQAENWLSLVQTDGQRPLLIDTDEAMVNADGLAAVVSGWLGLDLEPAWPDVAADADPALVWLSEHYCALDRRVMRLHEELLASSTPLPGNAGADAPRHVPTAAELDQTLSRYQAMLAAEREAVAQDAERNQLLLRLHETQSTLEVSDDRLRAHSAQVRALQLQVEQTSAAHKLQEHLKAENMLLLTQLHSIQGEVQAMMDSEHGLKAQLALALDEAAGAREANAQRQLLSTQLQQSQAAFEALGRQQDATIADLRRRLNDRPAGDDAALQRALRDRETLAEQLYRALSQTPSAGDAAPNALRFDGLADSLSVEHARDAAPHRELLLLASHVELGHTVHPTLRFKLVEHEGRPGLALLATATAPRALGQWQPTGREADAEYMLLVPADPAGRQTLDRLGTTDWQAVLTLADLAQQAVAASEQPLAPHWPVVAARLVEQLRSLPARLRYDTIDVSAPTPTLRTVRLRNALYGPKPLSDVTLEWRPESDAPLAWLLPEGDLVHPPLARWPVLATGQLAPNWPIGVGSAGGLRSRIRWWHQCLPEERNLLLGLLDALPAAARSATQDAGTEAARLAASAQRLRGQARQACRWGRLAALLGRGRR